MRSVKIFNSFNCHLTNAVIYSYTWSINNISIIGQIIVVLR